MSQRSVPIWVVAYKVKDEAPWSIQRNLAGPGHAADVSTQMLAGGYTKAIAVCGRLVIDIPDEPVVEKGVGQPEAKASELPEDKSDGKGDS